MNDIPPEALIRARPNPNAPTAPSFLKKWLYLIPLRVAMASIMVPLTLLLSTWDYVQGKAPPHQSLALTLLSAFLRVVGRIVLGTGIPSAESEASIWKIPTAQLAAAQKLGNEEERREAQKVRVALVKVPPVEDRYITGIAKVPGVKAVARPSWMMWYDDPSCQSGKGAEPAKPGERVILYFYKGYVGPLTVQ